MVKYLECPNCGFVFKAPVMDLKFTKLGVTFPGTGIVRCPECKQEKRRKHYAVVPESDLAKNATSKANDGTAQTKPAAESDLIEESRFEDEN